MSARTDTTHPPGLPAGTLVAHRFLTWAGVTVRGKDGRVVCQTAPSYSGFRDRVTWAPDDLVILDREGTA